MRKLSLVVMAAILVLALATVAMAGEPFVGTWKLNLAKSKYASTPAKSSTIKFTAQDNGMKHVGEEIKADGNPGHSEFAAKFDGKDYPFIYSPDVDTIAIKRIDANTWDEVFKKAGKQIGTARVVVSKDGKTITRTHKEKNAKGEDVIDISVYDKQ